MIVRYREFVEFMVSLVILFLSYATIKLENSHLNYLYVLLDHDERNEVGKINAFSMRFSIRLNSIFILLNCYHWEKKIFLPPL